MRLDEDRQAVERIVRQLQRERAAQGLTQADIAERMGVTQATVSQFERGGDPRLTSVQRYARALGVTLSFTLWGDR